MSLALPNYTDPDEETLRRLMARRTVNTATLGFPGYRAPRGVYAPRPVPQPKLEPIVIEPSQPARIIQPQEQDGGWGEILGNIGGNLLSGYLANRKKSASSKRSGYNEFASPSVKRAVKSEHIKPLPWIGSKEKNQFATPGFAHGGYVGSNLIGKRIRYAEFEPEVSLAEDGTYQILMEPGEGIVNRETTIIPFSKFKAAMEQAGHTVELPESSPSSLPGYNPQPPDKLSSLGLPGFDAKAFERFSKTGPDGSGPALLPHEKTELNRAVGPGYQVDGFDSKPLEMLKGQPPVNEFASPFVASRHSSNSVPEVSPLPVDERRPDVREVQGQVTADWSNAPVPPSARRAVPRPTDAPKMQRTGDYLTDSEKYLRDLDAYEPKDNNGFWKSVALTAGRAFLQGLSSGNLIYALGSAIFGAAHGVFDRGADEKFAKQYNISQTEHKRARVIARRMELARMRGTEAEASVKVQAAADYPAQQAVKERKALWTELKNRLQANKGALSPDDSVGQEIAGKLNAVVKMQGRGGGPRLVPNSQRFSDGQYVGLEYGPDGGVVPVVYFDNGSGEMESRRLSISLAEFNLRLAREGLPPVQFSGDASPQSSAPLPAGPATPEMLGGAGGSNLPTNNTIVTPPYSVPVGQPPNPSTPQLVPTGAPAPVLPERERREQRYERRRRERRGGGGSSSGAGGLDKYEEGDLRRAKTDLVKARAFAAKARAEAKSAEGRLEDPSLYLEEAAAQEEAAREAESVVNTLEAKKGGRRSDDRPSLPSAELSTRESGLFPRVAKQYTEAEIRAEALRNNVNPDAAVEYARKNRKLKQ